VTAVKKKPSHTKVTAVVGYTIAADGLCADPSTVDLSALFESLDEARAEMANLPADIIEALHVRIYEVREVTP
jgi:hypothetical protein